MANFNIHTSNKPKKQIRKENIGIVLMVVFSTLLFFLAFNILPFLNSFLLGTFGLLSFAVCVFAIVLGLLLKLNRPIFLDKQEIIFISVWFFVFVLLIHLITTQGFIDTNYANYIATTFTVKNTAGGIIWSILLYPLFYLTHLVATYVLLTVALVVLTTVIIDKLFSNRQYRKINAKTSTDESDVKQNSFSEEDEDYTHKQIKKQPTKKPLVYDNDEDSVIISDDDFETDFTTEEDEEEVYTEEDRKKAKEILGLSEKDKEQAKTLLQKSKEVETFNYANAKNQGVNKKDYILNTGLQNNETENIKLEEPENLGRPRKIVHDFGVKQKPHEITEKPKRELSDSDKKNIEFLRSTLGRIGKRMNEQSEKEHALKELQIKQQQEESVANQPQNTGYEFDDLMEEVNKTIFDPTLSVKNYQQKYQYNPNTNSTVSVENGNVTQFNSAKQQLFGQNNENSEFNSQNQNSYIQNNSRPSLVAADGTNANNNSQNSFTTTNNPGQQQIKINQVAQNNKPQEFVKKVRRKQPYVKPPLELLKVYENDSNTDTEDYTVKAQMLEETLSSFKIPAKVVSITKGPAFTRFELVMPQGVPVKRVTSYVDDIAMILEAQGAVRVEIPIPGKNAFGVEIPNEKIDTVGLKDVLEAYSFQGSKSLLTFALGKDITGEAQVAKLDKMPHLLVAGATGSGKSVCLNSLLISLVYKASPEDLRIILIDPKRVEFTLYNGLPHLLIPNVITDPDKAVSALSWTIDEMERRFTLFSKYRVRNLDEFNQISEVANGYEEKLPYIVVVVDELADLMVISKKEIEEKIIRIAQKSRAAGIHLVLATQRPSVNVITGVIKANLPSRIAFAVTSYTDSKTILDQAGAENLLGKGDMLYSPSDMPDPMRIQGAFVSNSEVESIVEFIKENNEVDFDSSIEEQMFSKKYHAFEGGGSGGNGGEFDPLMKDALRLVIKSGNVSITKIQRVFGLGFPRAAKIVDQMEREGFISEIDSSKNRQVFITQQEFEERFGEDL